MMAMRNAILIMGFAIDHGYGIYSLGHTFGARHTLSIVLGALDRPGSTCEGRVNGQRHHTATVDSSRRWRSRHEYLGRATFASNHTILAQLSRNDRQI